MNHPEPNAKERELIRDLIDAESFAERIYSEAFFELRLNPAADSLAEIRLLHLQNLHALQRHLAQAGLPVGPRERRCGPFASDPRSQITGIEAGLILDYLARSEGKAAEQHSRLVAHSDLSDDATAVIDEVLAAHARMAAQRLGFAPPEAPASEPVDTVPGFLALI